MGARIYPDDWITDEKLKLITGWARRGFTTHQIADAIGIGNTTLYKWRKEYPEINKAMSAGKDEADIAVENALFKRATGYDVEETHVEYEAGIEVKRVINTRHIPPDTGAICFWLKNRCPDLWRDKHEYNADFDGTIKIVMSDPIEELSE